MSNLSDKTDRVAIAACAKAIRELDCVSFSMHVTREDDLHWVEARRHLWAIVQSNGYEIDNKTYRVRRVNSGYPDYKPIK